MPAGASSQHHRQLYRGLLDHVAVETPPLGGQQPAPSLGRREAAVFPFLLLEEEGGCANGRQRRARRRKRSVTPVEDGGRVEVLVGLLVVHARLQLDEG